jgi:hypothetical protein
VGPPWDTNQGGWRSAVSYAAGPPLTGLPAEASPARRKPRSTRLAPPGAHWRRRYLSSKIGAPVSGSYPVIGQTGLVSHDLSRPNMALAGRFRTNK